MAEPDSSSAPLASAQPLVFVLGPTASGKTSLAAALARSLNGEVISADAMAVYRGMDIGTAKPSAAELASVPHHLISIIEPEDRCDVSRWLALAEHAIAATASRGHLPLIAGGSPMYTKALLEGLSAGAPRCLALRAELDLRYAQEGGIALLHELTQVDPTYADDRHANDQKRIVRALEVWLLTGVPYSAHHTTDGVRRAEFRTVLLGLDWPRDVLHRRINRRVKDMFAAGLLDEVRAIAPRLSPEARQAVGYKEVLGVLDGSIDLARAIELVSRNTRILARHQSTWYRRFRDIVWLPGDSPDLMERAAKIVRERLG